MTHNGPDHDLDEDLEIIPRVSGIVHLMLFAGAFVVGFIAGIML